MFANRTDSDIDMAPVFLFVECLHREFNLVLDELSVIGDQFFDQEQSIPAPSDTRLAWGLFELRGSANRAKELQYRYHELLKPFDTATIIDFVLAVKSRNFEQLSRASEILEVEIKGLKARLPFRDDSAVTAKELANHADVDDRTIRDLIHGSLGKSGPHIFRQHRGRTGESFVYWRIVNVLRAANKSRVSRCHWPDRKAELCCRK